MPKPVPLRITPLSSAAHLGTQTCVHLHLAHSSPPFLLSHPFSDLQLRKAQPSSQSDAQTVVRHPQTFGNLHSTHKPTSHHAYQNPLRSPLRAAHLWRWWHRCFRTALHDDARRHRACCLADCSLGTKMVCQRFDFSFTFEMVHLLHVMRSFCISTELKSFFNLWKYPSIVNVPARDQSSSTSSSSSTEYSFLDFKNATRQSFCLLATVK